MTNSAPKLMLPVLGENRWIQAARVLLVFLLMAAPLAFGSVEPWAWATIVVCSFLTTLLWATGCVTARQLRISWMPLYLPLLLLLLEIVVQHARNVTFDPISARESGVKFVAYLVLFFLARELFGRASQRVWSGLGLAVTAYVFAVALFATIQFFSSPGLLYWTKRPLWGGIVFGPYVNHNHYAGLMEVLIPIALGYVVSTRRETARPVLVFAILLATASVLLSGSRGGLVSVVVEFMIFAVLLLRHRLGVTRGRAAIVAGLGSMAAILLLFLWLDPGDVTRRLEETATSPEMSIADRKLYASDAFRMVRDYPVLGIGAGSFEAAYPSYQSFSSDLIVNHAHNDYIEALAETGVVGSVLVLSTIVLFCRQIWSNRRRQDSTDWIGVGAAVGCCGLLIHSFSDFNLHIPANAAWFAFAGGIATVCRNHRSRERKDNGDHLVSWQPMNQQESCL